MDTIPFRRVRYMDVSYLLALAFLGLGLTLRWARPTLVEFGFDEALTTRLALLIAHWGYRPAVGVQASIGPYQFPVFLYLAALPLKFWPSPLALVYFIAFLNALTVPLAYVMGRRYWGPWAGATAAFLLAVNAWSVAYARKIWTQNITLFTALFFLAMFLTFVEERPWALAGAWLGVAVLIGLHLEGMAFLFVLGPAMLIWRRQVRWKPLVLGVVLFALVLGPYFVHDARQGWQNVRRFFTYTGTPAIVTLHAVDFAFRLGSGRQLFALAGLSAPMYKAQLPPLWEVDTLMEIVLAAAILFAAARVVRGRGAERRSYALLLLWFWVPVLLQLYHTRPVFPHYFTILYPAHFLLIGAFVAWLVEARPRRWHLVHRALRVGLPAFFILWAIWQVVSFQTLLSFVERHPTPGGFGVPLQHDLVAVEKARAAAQGAEIVVMAPDAELEWNVFRLMFDDLLFTHPRRFVNGQNTVVVSRHPSVYLIGPMKPVHDPMEPSVRLLLTLPTVEVVDTVSLPDGRGFLVVRSTGVPSRLPDAFHPFDTPIRLDSGVRFLGYVMQPGEEGLTVWVAWVREHSSPRFYHLFVHAVDAEGGSLAVGDASALLPYHQRQGEWGFSRVVLRVDERAVGHLEVGMYTWPDLTRARVETSCPTCMADHIRITAVVESAQQ